MVGMERRKCPHCAQQHNVIEAIALPGVDELEAKLRELDLSLKRNPRKLNLRCPKSGERIYYSGQGRNWTWRSK